MSRTGARGIAILPWRPQHRPHRLGVEWVRRPLRHRLHGGEPQGHRSFAYTRLDRSVLIQADLSGADLTGATIFRPTIYTDLSSSLADAPRFAGANLTNIRVMANLSGADFRGANLTNADLRPLEMRPGQGTLSTLMRNVLRSCDFSGATLRDANLNRAVLTFSRFVGADLRGGHLSDTDLSKTDFAGADLTGADLTRADLYGANLAGIKGFDTVKGLDSVANLDKAER